MKVFISRDLTEDSVFLTQLLANGITVEGRSLVVFKPLNFSFETRTEWLFFYSKTGIKFFIEKITPEKIKAVRIAVLGEASASVFEKLTGRKPDFIGLGQPESTAEAFLRVAAGKDVTFVRARNSRQSVQQLLDGKIITKEIIVYHNDILENIKKTEARILVFTSPLNAEAYFKTFKKDDTQKVIAIGETTASALLALNMDKVYTVDFPSEKKLAEAVLVFAASEF
jgi:uroporphyrinogen-III synthase